MTKKKPPDKKLKAGAPDLYLKEPERFNVLVEGLSLLGLTEEEIARHLGVTHQTITNWKHKYPKFLAALKKGREEADINVVRSLYKRACGYKYIDTFIDKSSGDVKTIEKYMHPDVTAQIFWLKNRQYNYWREKKETNVDMPDVNVQFKIQ